MRYYSSIRDIHVELGSIHLSCLKYSNAPEQYPVLSL